MARSIAPGDIATQPNSKVVFNAPYDDEHTYYIKVINTSARRIAWTLHSSSVKIVSMEPDSGVLRRRKSAMVAVNCAAFTYVFSPLEDTPYDERITIEWTNTPEGTGKHFRRKWFARDGIVRRKNIVIDYNL